MGDLRIERVSASGRQWVLDGAWADALRERLLARPDRPEDLPGFRRLKENNARTVYRFSDGAGGFVVKCFKAVSGVARLKERVVGSRAAQEWARLRLLLDRGVPVPEAAATWTGEHGPAAGESGLVTREVASARTLKEVLAGADPAGVRNLLRAAAELAARAHAAGFLHRDLHAGNLLVDPAGALVLVDVHRGRVGSPPGPRERLHNLALLAYSLTIVLPRTGWRRLLRDYLDQLAPEVRAHPLLSDPHRCAVVLSAQVDRLRARHQRHRTRRCLRNGTGFQVSERGDWRLYVARGIDPEAVLRVVLEHDARSNPARATSPAGPVAPDPAAPPPPAGAVAPPAAAGAPVPNHAPFASAPALVKDTRRVKVSREVLPTSSGERSVFVKAFRAEGIRVRMKRALGADPGKRAWVAANGLRVRGLPTPEALAYVEPRSRSGPLHSYLITAARPAAMPLDRFVAAHFAGPGNGDRADRDRFLADLTSLVRRLHRAGVFHHDLKANNLLVRTEGDGYQFELIDLDRVSFSGGLSREARMTNLAQLNAATPGLLTRADRLRCLRAYAVGSTTLGDLRESVRWIMRASVARRHVWPPRRATAEPS